MFSLLLTWPRGRVQDIAKGSRKQAVNILFACEIAAREDILELGAHGFPRDWPDVYQESECLRALLKASGPCKAKRVSVVPAPEPLETWDVVKRHDFRAF